MTCAGAVSSADAIRIAVMAFNSYRNREGEPVRMRMKVSFASATYNGNSTPKSWRDPKRGTQHPREGGEKAGEGKEKEHKEKFWQGVLPGHSGQRESQECCRMSRNCWGAAKRRRLLSD